ncbi:basic salivary proline-rich protein 2-like [Lemur catta]|uniref:basic salivary proline-rich protein 2-like n=1 Tax=Lemur catta TaxID=9447 RepID=UPI001E269761|nr:basic salivary proline-rich protein 2-like [Lemur catta]
MAEAGGLSHRESGRRAGEAPPPRSCRRGALGGTGRRPPPGGRRSRWSRGRRGRRGRRVRGRRPLCPRFRGPESPQAGTGPSGGAPNPSVPPAGTPAGPAAPTADRGDWTHRLLSPGRELPGHHSPCHLFQMLQDYALLQVRLEKYQDRIMDTSEEQ